MNQEEQQQAESQKIDHQEIGYEEELLRALAFSGQINDSFYDKILQRLKEKIPLSDALNEYDALTPELLSTCNDCKALVDQGTVTISQLIVALYDYQIANIPIKESLYNRGWLK
jgi:hypothetical protein